MTRACQSFFPFERSVTTRPPWPTSARCCARRTTSFPRPSARAWPRCDPRNAVHVELPDGRTPATRPRDLRPLAGGRDAGARRAAADLRLRAALSERPTEGRPPAAASSAGCAWSHTDRRAASDPTSRRMSAAKEDRFQLMKAVRANLSPVLFLYDDAERGHVRRTAHRRADRGRAAGSTRRPGWPAEPDVACGPGTSRRAAQLAAGHRRGAGRSPSPTAITATKRRCATATRSAATWRRAPCSR